MNLYALSMTSALIEQEWGELASCLVDFSGNALTFSHLSKMLAKELLNVIIMCVIMPRQVPLFLDSLGLL